MEYRFATKEGVLTVKDYKKGLEVVSYEGEDIYLTVPGDLRIEKAMEHATEAEAEFAQGMEPAAQTEPAVASKTEKGQGKPVISI